MKFVIQRVTECSVTVDGQVIGAIRKGFLVLIGAGREDTRENADALIKKMIGLRIFEDENGKTNLKGCGWKPSAGISVYPLCKLQKGQPTKLYRGRRAKDGRRVV